MLLLCELQIEWKIKDVIEKEGTEENITALLSFNIPYLLYVQGRSKKNCFVAVLIYPAQVSFYKIFHGVQCPSATQKRTFLSLS